MLDGKNIAVLVGGQVDECAVEIIEIIRAMKGVNARVRVVSSPVKRSIGGKDGNIRVDMAIDKARAADFDAIILCTDCRSPGSRAHSYCTRLLRDAYEQGKLIAAINKGVELVGMAGLLPAGIPLPSAVAAGGNLEAGRPPARRSIIKEANLIMAGDSIHLMSFVREIIGALRLAKKPAD